MKNFIIKTIISLVISASLVSTASAFYGSNPGLSGTNTGYYYGNYNTFYGYVSRPVQEVPVGTAPVINSQPVTSARVGVLYSYLVQASDPNGDRLSFALTQSPSGMAIDSGSGAIAWTPSSNQANRSFTVQVSVTDATGLSALQSFAVGVGASQAIPAQPQRVASGNSAYNPQASIFSIFRSNKEPEALEISEVTAFSGPQNVYDDQTKVNCSVHVSWSTNLPSTGQVVYGPVSQESVEAFAYPMSSPEPNSLNTAHQVKLDCLQSQTYYFRVIAFTAGERVVSNEFTVIPFKVETPIGGIIGGDDGLASALGTIGSVALPALILLFSISIVYLAIKRIRRGLLSGRPNTEEAPVEPVISIPDIPTQ